MLPDNIDDLFHQKLDGHATPPAPDLWARLALPQADADPTDATFQDGLRNHATPPRRELWERLEDEHLRPQPRRRRAVAWWQLSAAAVLLLMLVGGALWSGSWRQAATGGPVASRSGHGRPATGATSAAPATSEATRTTTDQVTEEAATQAQNLTASQPAPAAAEKNKEIFAPQATAPRSSTSSTPIARTTRPRRPATAPRASTGSQPQRSRPDVAVSKPARLGERKTPASQSPTTSQPTTPVLPPTTSDTNAPVLAVAPPPVAEPEVIEVEVRRGGARPTPAVAAVAEEAPAAPTRRRGLRLGGLLHQADRLVHGELAEATGLPETVTLQARLGGRVVSKTIQL